MTGDVVDLSACDREPIQSPGGIQPYGMMLVVEAAGLRIRYVAGDVERRLGLSDWRGMALHHVVGVHLAGRVAVLFDPPDAVSQTATGYIGQMLTPLGETLDVSAHVSAPFMIIDLETAAASPATTSEVLDTLAAETAAFEQASTVAALCDRAAVAFRSMTRFDRVMVYQFLDNGVGKVVAEARAAHMGSFLHLHFPATDIPVQARALYLRNRIRVIQDNDYLPAPLRPAWPGVLQLDMSDSSLRSVSPVHLQYMRNMGVRASASISIVRDGVLWGLIACHNDTPRGMTFDVRASCRAMAASLGRRIRAKEEAETFRQRILLRNFEDNLVRRLMGGMTLDLDMAHHLLDVALMMRADGVAMVRGAKVATSGVCPSEVEIRALAGWVQNRSLDPVFATSHLPALYRPASAYGAFACGVLAMVMSVEEPWQLICFRAEQTQKMKWAGEPSKVAQGSVDHLYGAFDQTRPVGVVEAGLQAVLSPRTSFATWVQTVRGHARPWTAMEIDAAMRLQVALLGLQQNRRMREINGQLNNVLKQRSLLSSQKDFLIGEIGHRVENSLRVVSEFLSVQSEAATSHLVKVELDEAHRRMNAVIQVHRQLYTNDAPETVQLSHYLEQLCSDTMSFMGRGWAQHLSWNLAAMEVSTGRAVLLGLVLTELLIGCSRSAYEGAPGPIEIDATATAGRLRIVVVDRGAARVAANSDISATIIARLVRQLGGEIAYTDNHPGLRSVMTVPLDTLWDDSAVMS